MKLYYIAASYQGGKIDFTLDASMEELRPLYDPPI